MENSREILKDVVIVECASSGLSTALHLPRLDLAWANRRVNLPVRIWEVVSGDARAEVESLFPDQIVKNP